MEQALMPETTVTDDRLSLEYARLHAECERTIAQLMSELEAVTEERDHWRRMTKVARDGEVNAMKERDRALELIAGLIFLGAERESA